MLRHVFSNQVRYSSLGLGLIRRMYSTSFSSTLSMDNSVRTSTSSQPNGINGMYGVNITNNPQLTIIRTATKKAGGSTSNSKDSAGRRLGIKVWPGTTAKPGSIIVRQRGKKFMTGQNTGMGNDHTVFAKVGGIVRFERSAVRRKRIFVHVVDEGDKL